jgi:hypothetical protein
MSLTEFSPQASEARSREKAYRNTAGSGPDKEERNVSSAIRVSRVSLTVPKPCG